jgi:serine phosphatase RsbU (regulator of sigma subunit)
MFDTERFRASQRSSQLTLASGDYLVLHTDGWTEAHNDRGEQLGADAMIQCCRSGESAARVLEGLRTRVHEHRGSEAASDDLTLLVLRRRPALAQAPAGVESELVA